jgi:hypothetical protein
VLYINSFALFLQGEGREGEERETERKKRGGELNGDREGKGRKNNLRAFLQYFCMFSQLDLK